MEYRNPIIAKAGYYNGQRYKSQMEIKYAKYLDFLIKHREIQDWKYEPRIFDFRDVKGKKGKHCGVVTYKPDFWILNKNGLEEYAEVKGYMDKRSQTKLNSMRIYYPNVKISVIDGNWFKQHRKDAKLLGWG